MKIEKVRCPLKDECGAKVCDYENRERECSYYFANARDGMSLEDQEMPLNYDFDDICEAEEKGELKELFSAGAESKHEDCRGN